VEILDDDCISISNFKDNPYEACLHVLTTRFVYKMFDHFVSKNSKSCKFFSLFLITM